MSTKSLEVALKIVAQATGKQHISAMVDELKHIASSSEDGGIEAAKLANELDTLAQQQDLIHSFQQSTQVLEKQELATIAAAQGLEKLQKEAQETNKPFVELARNLDVAEKDFEQMRKALSQQTSHHKKLQKQLGKTGVSADNLTAKKRELARGFTTVGKKVDTYTQKLKQGSAAQRKHGQGLEGIAGKIIGLTAAYVGLNQVSTAIKDIFSTGDKFERLSIQMDALMGSIEGGETATAWVKEFTKKTPLQLADVSKAFVKLKAFGLDPMDGTMQAITDQAFKLGGGFQEVEGVSLALGQAWAKQKLQGEEILQLVERGIPVWDLLEKSTGKNTLALQKLSSAGKLGRDVIKDLITEMGKGAVGAAEANMALLSGQISNAKDNIDQFYHLISESGAMDWLKGQLTAINAQFSEMTKDGSLKVWAQSISDTIVSTGEAIKKSFTVLYEYKDHIAAIAKVWLTLKIGNYFTDIVKGATLASTSLKTHNASMKGTAKVTTLATIATQKFTTALKGIGKATVVLVALELLFAAVQKVNDMVNEYSDTQKRTAASEKKLAESSAALSATYRKIAIETKVNITNAKAFHQALNDGVIVWDKTLGRYQSAEQAQARLTQSTQHATEQEKQRIKMMTLTLDQAINTTNQLEKQAVSMDGVRGGVEGFITAIDAAKTTLLGAGEHYAQQVILLEQLREKYVAHNASLERQAYLAGDVSKAYEVLGIKSGAALTELAQKQRGAFELIKQSNEPIKQQEKAFLAWAKSAVEAADATGEITPTSLKATAATLGLSTELEKLISQANKLKPVNDTNSDSVNRFTAEIKKTTQAITQNEAVLKSSSASALQKKEAQALLTIQQIRLKEETADLNKIQQLEEANLRSLQREQKSLEQEMVSLNKQYERGSITSQEYNTKQQRMSDMLGVVNGLLGDFKNAQDKATDSTIKHTKATQDSTKAVQETVKERRTLVQTYEAEAGAASKAQQAQEYSTRQSDTANAQTIVDFEESNNVAEHLRSKREDVIELRRKKHSERQQKERQAHFEKTLASAKDSNTTLAELDAIYKKTTQTLGGFGGQYSKQLRDAIATNKAARRSENTNTQHNEKYSTTPQSQQVSSELTQQLNELINTLKTQGVGTRNASGKTIRLELMLGGEVFKAELMEAFEEKFIATLEQAHSVGGVGASA
jgi:tape measure domain-containing protein